ncbi:NAD(P)-dependent oxidoreductase [Motiliproteus coralliicola]|uniref:NAD(P)-dependent oxidoreductase n=1 Tax=Motiliproteus coralliicola TaxID=2283196 RepID=A0A369WAG9_9GAMM|nr:NAD(P)-dependent oxidoreductase [Motiliproteus coralliicola]
MVKQRIGVIGLGSMGNGMCQSLLRGGFEVFGTDLGVPQRQAAEAIGVTLVDSIAQLCQQTEIILLSLPTAQHVKQVIVGDDGILQSAQPSTLVIDTSTSEPDVTRGLAEQLASQGHALLDAPVSGGPSGAAAGTMVMVIGGKEADLQRAMPFIEALSAKAVHLGPSGSGHAAKLINNLLCAAHLVTTAEAVALGQKAGLDPAKLLEGLNAGSGRSAVSEVNFPRWILNNGFDSGFTMQLMRKDVRLAEKLCRDLELELPLSEQVAKIWAASEPTIPDQDDFNCIVKTTGLET